MGMHDGSTRSHGEKLHQKFPVHPRGYGVKKSSEKSGKMEPRMERAFQKMESEPVETAHKGKVSGCME